MNVVPKACVMGHPVTHSRSPMIHNYWLRTLAIAGAYERADVTQQDFPGFLKGLRQHGYVGGNITVPHKETAYLAVDRRDGAADAIGAVNTVWHEGEMLVGGNTDAHGFITHLETSVPHWSRHARRAVVMGAGGAARAVIHALLGSGLELDLVNRTAGRARHLAAHFGGAITVHEFADLPRLLPDADLLVNTTSLGMTGSPPLALDLAPLKGDAIVYDIVYVPLETGLLKAARTRGHRTVDGLGVLLHQAAPAFARWFGTTPQVTPELRELVAADIRAKTENA